MRRIKHMRMLPVFLMAVVAVIFSPVVIADRDDEDEEIPFDQATIFFEFNSTDNDLGVQVLLDGDAWDRLKIVDPRGRRLLEIKADGSLGKLGLTELFWESDEPSPAEVLALFKAGKYEFEGKTVEGVELESEAVLSQQLPAPPDNLFPDGHAVDSTRDLTIEWSPGTGGAVPDASYQLILEREDLGVEILVVTLLDASTTEVTIPAGFLEPDTEYKYEVLAVAGNGNKTIAETEFFTQP